MQLALGFGIFATRFPNSAAVRLLNVSTHAIFDVGLYLGAATWLLIAT
jgi:hypothetical protein